jgi:hypothetical protein
MMHVEKACELITTDYKHVLEFGVFRGTTIQIIKEKLNNPDYKIYGFDSFEGLPEDWVAFDGNVAGEGVCKAGFFTNDGIVPDIPGITFYKGWFEDTIKEYLRIAEPIALLHVDCDLYSSTKTVLYNLNDYIKEGTIIVFDEWIYNGNPAYNDHEQKCFHEWAVDFNRYYELIDHVNEGWINEQQIVKILN